MTYYGITLEGHGQKATLQFCDKSVIFLNFSISVSHLKFVKQTLGDKKVRLVAMLLEADEVRLQSQHWLHPPSPTHLSLMVIDINWHLNPLWNIVH